MVPFPDANLLPAGKVIRTPMAQTSKARPSTLDVSVVIPTYDSMSGSKCVAKTVRSAQEQEGVKLEVIVVDNESKDGTVEVCRELGVRFRSVSSSRSEARNLGICMARGEYLLFLDSDHEIQSGALAEAVSLARDGKLDAVFLRHTYVRQQEDGTISDSPLNMELKIRAPNRIPNLYKKSSILGLRFDPSLDFAEDYAFFHEFKRQGPRLGELGWGLIHYDPANLGEEVRRSYAYGRAFHLGPRIPEVHRLLLRISIANGFSAKRLLRTLGDNPRAAIRAFGAVPIKYAAFLLGYVGAILTSD